MAGIEINLEGKVALVTGASRGIGEAVAKRLAQAGADVVINSTESSRDRLNAVASEIEAYGHRILALPGDVSLPATAGYLVGGAVEAFSRLDILVHSAGIVRDNLFQRMTLEQWREVISTNLDSAFYLAQASANQIRKQRAPGNMVFISSVVAHGHAGQANYAASKGGLESLTRSIAEEFAAHDERRIRSNAIACALVDTDMAARLTDQQREKVVERIPIERMIRTEEVANAALYLASDFSSPITGIVLDVDGGMLRR